MDALDRFQLSLGGHDEHLGAESLRLADPSRESRHRAQLPGESDLTDRDQRRRHREVVGRRGDRQGERHVHARLVRREPAGGGGEDVETAGVDAAARLEHREQERESRRGHLVGDATSRPRRPRDERLNLDEKRA